MSYWYKLFHTTFLLYENDFQKLCTVDIEGFSNTTIFMTFTTQRLTNPPIKSFRLSPGQDPWMWRRTSHISIQLYSLKLVNSFPHITSQPLHCRKLSPRRKDRLSLSDENLLPFVKVSYVPFLNFTTESWMNSNTLFIAIHIGNVLKIHFLYKKELRRTSCRTIKNHILRYRNILTRANI